MFSFVRVTVVMVSLHSKRAVAKPFGFEPFSLLYSGQNLEEDLWEAMFA